jgi:DNA invertase Pin-like site-specific DNA recombinase
MGWEQRGNNHSCYYRKEREGGGAKSVYLGRDDLARMLSDLQAGSGVFEKTISALKPAATARLRERCSRKKHVMEFSRW